MSDVTVLERLDANDDIEDLIMKTASAKAFRKLGTKHKLIVHVQGSLCRVAETYYLSKSADHNIGDVKEPAHEYRMFSITITNALDFAAQAVWYERFPKFADGTPKPPVFMFDSGRVGGQRTPFPKGAPGYFTQTTKMNKEITSCLN